MSYTPQNDRLFNEGDDPEWDTVQIETEQKTPVMVYFHAFFLVIASVLGTGILGLPVKSAESGFTPFLFSYAIGFFMQALIMVYMIELLQRGKVETELQHVQERIDSHTEALKDMDFTDTGDDVVSLADDLRDDTENDTLTLGERDIMPVVVQEVTKELPHNDADLHFLGKTFLHTSMRVVFDISVVLHFISILVSYNLAGSQAYAQLMGVNYEYLIVPFGIVCTVVIVFAGLVIQPIISIMTFAKGSLLVLMVIVTAVIAANINEPIINNWSHVGRPFLLGTVALGGAANVLPVVFAKAQMKRSDMLKLCIAAVSGLVFVWLLNVLWCYYILKSVPQDAPGDEISLHRAELLGQISTVPLIEIIRGGYPQYTWIAYVVNVFVMVSITVSFITMGTGLKHVLDGFIRSMALNFKQATDQHLNGFDKALFAMRNLKTVWKQVLMYCGFFGIVLLIAVTNPRAFLIIMEKVTSMALNLSLGAFIGIMLGSARKQQQFSNIPLPLHKFLFHLRWAVIVYFVFAVVFDIVSIVLLMFDIRL